MAIVGRILAADVRPPFQHYTCQRPALFDEYTPRGFARACETVREAWAESAVRGREMEKLLGISWLEGRALLFLRPSASLQDSRVGLLGRTTQCVGERRHRPV